MFIEPDQDQSLPTINGGQTFILMLGQIDAAATRRQLGQAAHRDFLTQLAAARADLAAFVERPARCAPRRWQRA